MLNTLSLAESIEVGCRERWLLASPAAMGSPNHTQHHPPENPTQSFLVFVYTSVYTMMFEWDPQKSASNLLERGFDFEFATLVFEGRTLERDDRRMDYGERRIVAMGLHLTVVYTDRDQEGGDPVRRIISARRSNRREREVYQKAIPS